MELNTDGCLGLNETQGKKSYAHLTSHSKHSTSRFTECPSVIYQCYSAQSQRVVNGVSGMLARHYFDWFALAFFILDSLLDLGTLDLIPS